MSNGQTFFNIILAIIVSTILSIYDSWVFSFIWNGFMPKTFGLPMLGVVQAYLVLMVASMPFYGAVVRLTVHMGESENASGVDAIATSIGVAVAFTVALVMNVIWSQFL